MNPINKWPAQDAEVYDDADGSREVFLPAGDRPTWATRYETDSGGLGADLTVAGEPSPVELQLDHQMDGEVHLGRASPSRCCSRGWPGTRRSRWPSWVWWPGHSTMPAITGTDEQVQLRSAMAMGLGVPTRLARMRSAGVSALGRVTGGGRAYARGMGFRYRRRVSLGKHLWLNVSKSGLSVSGHAGPLTVNSRGRKTVHLAPGLSYQTQKRLVPSAPTGHAPTEHVEVATPQTPATDEHAATPARPARHKAKTTRAEGIVSTVLAVILAVSGALAAVGGAPVEGLVMVALGVLLAVHGSHARRKAISDHRQP